MSFLVPHYRRLLKEVFVSCINPCEIFSATINPSKSVGISKSGVWFVITAEVRFVIVNVRYKTKDRISSFWVATNSEYVWVVSGCNDERVICARENDLVLKLANN